MDPLQIFLIINIFVLGAVIALAIEHLWLHLHPRDTAVDQDGVHLPIQVKERLLKVAESDYEEVLNKSVGSFKDDLAKTTEKINDTLTQLSGDILGEEMDRYKKTLEELKEKAQQTRSQAQTDVERHQAELEALIIERQKMLEQRFLERQAAIEKQAQAEVQTTKKAYIERIDAKLADSVTSFLSTTLQYNADLGAQEPYLLSELEKHKSELIKEVTDEV